VALIRRAPDGHPPSFTLEEHETSMFVDCLGWKPVPADYTPRNIAQPLQPIKPPQAPGTGRHLQRIRINPPVHPSQPQDTPALIAVALERQVVT
jgi:hypothetical protein